MALRHLLSYVLALWGDTVSKKVNEHFSWDCGYLPLGMVVAYFILVLGMNALMV